MDTPSLLQSDGLYSNSMLMHLTEPGEPVLIPIDQPELNADPVLGYLNQASSLTGSEAFASSTIINLSAFQSNGQPILNSAAVSNPSWNVEPAANQSPVIVFTFPDSSSQTMENQTDEAENEFKEALDNAASLVSDYQQKTPRNAPKKMRKGQVLMYERNPNDESLRGKPKVQKKIKKAIKSHNFRVGKQNKERTQMDCMSQLVNAGQKMVIKYEKLKKEYKTFKERVATTVASATIVPNGFGGPLGECNNETTQNVSLDLDLFDFRE